MFAQSPSSDYTNDLPSVERVKAEIKGSDPTDTLARHVAVFTYLQTYIDRIKSNRSQRGSFTPGESKMWNAYRNAAYQISQDYAKTHTPAEAQAFERLHGYYTMNGAFYDDWSKRLIGPQSAAAYKNAEAGLAAAGERRYQQEMQQYKQDRAAQQAADKQIFGTQGLSDDPTAVAARRCLELGGSTLGCMGKGLSAGIMDLAGFGADAQESLMGPGRAGVVLKGVYKNPSTVTALNFDAASVSLNGCGKLADDAHNYSIEKRSGLVRITIDNEPSPIVLTMRPDGGLVGPGMIDVKGRIIVGYFTSTHYENGVATGTTSTPDYRPAMGRCVVGSLVKPPNPPSMPSAAQSASDGSAIGTLTGMIGSFVPDAGEVGLRMTGKYGGGNLLLDFSGNSLVLDCGQAHVRQPYTVENTSNALLVHVQNSAGPFTLAVQPDNSLRGAGSTTVNGRLVAGMNGDNVTFAPHSETCEVGTIRPKTGATPTASVATAPPAPAPAAPAASAPVVSAPAATGGTSIKLTIISSFPGGANPLAGATVALMSERFDTLLRKVGAPIAADVTPGKALQAYAANCFPPRSCPAYATAMHPYYVVKGNFDSTGRAVLTAQVPAGTYYVFCSAKGPNGPYVWDVSAQLKVGENTITLTAGNAELLH
ncbi:MAG TPA: hypothetical protein VLB68_25340 [Pyrinomonadaceae bacterium]|nr:hypothetical protein [Pyrinomonadaceae bacterium]